MLILPCNICACCFRSANTEFTWITHTRGVTLFGSVGNICLPQSCPSPVLQQSYSNLPILNIQFIALSGNFIVFLKCFYFDCMRRFLWIMLFPGLHWKRDWMSIVWHDHQRSCWHDKQGGIWQSKTKHDPVRLKWPDLQDGQDYHRAGFRDTEVNFFKTNITFACLPVFLTHHGVQIIKIIPLLCFAGECWI